MAYHDRDCTCASCEAEAYTRNNYFTGKLMVERDFTDEQKYFREKLRIHHQRLHGHGVVCGLNIRAHDPPCDDRYVILEPGSAVDCCGNDILVVNEDIIDLQSFGGMQDILQEMEDPETPEDRTWDLQICISYTECPTEDVPVIYDECGCDDSRCAPNRILESYCIDLLVNPEIADASFLSPSLDWTATININDIRHISLQDEADRLFILTGGPTSTVYQVDTETLAIEASFSFGRAGLDILHSLSGDEVYVVAADAGGMDAGDASLLVFDIVGAGLGAGAVRTNPIAGSQSSDVTLLGLPDGRVAAVVRTGGGLRLWDAAVSGAPDDLGDLDAGAEIVDPVILSDGHTLLAAHVGTATLHMADLNSAGPTTSTITMAEGAADALALIASTGPDMIAIADGAANMLRLLNPADGGVVAASVTLDFQPQGVVVSKNGHWAYVLLQDGDDSFVQSVNLQRLREGLPVVPGTPIAVGNRSGEIALSETGGRLWVSYLGPDDDAGSGGIAVLDITETDCTGILFADDCPDCEGNDCLVLATIRGYRPGDRILDMPTPADDPAEGTVHINTSLGRQRLPSTQAIADALLCVMENCCGGAGGEGPQGPPGPPGEQGGQGDPGPPGPPAELPEVTRICGISWDHLGYYDFQSFPQIDVPFMDGNEPIAVPGFAIAFTRQTHYFQSLPAAIRNSGDPAQIVRYASRLVRLRVGVLADALSPVAAPDYTLWAEIPAMAMPAEMLLVPQDADAGTCQIEAINRLIPVDEDTSVTGNPENGLVIIPLVGVTTTGLQALFYRQILNEGSVPVPGPDNPSYAIEIRFDGNALIDFERNPIDAEHVAPFLPDRASGNGRAGSVFESAFFYNREPRTEPLQSDDTNPVRIRLPINSVDEAALMTLPGIGALTARAIIDARPIADEDDLLRIPGMGPTLIARILPNITFDQGGTS